MKILLAVDGSKASLDAVDCVIDHASWYKDRPEVELVTVHYPVPKLPRMGLAVGKAHIQRYYQEEGEKQLAAAKKMLDAAGLRYRAQILVGDIAESVLKQAHAARCDLICVGTRGMSALGKMIVGSTATRLLQISDLPVLLVK